jgi:2-amino-4-hydroxy-6-hydroxymethyldihydropteridine diphosphokinase
MAEVYVALGSNVGDTASHLREAVARIAKWLTIERVSSAYRTEPVGLRDQPFFLNAVLRARSELPPRDVLARLGRIEEDMGRQRDVPNGPRTIDLDLLLYDDVVVDEPPGLVVPHPRLASRRFVLVPLAEIAGHLRPLPSGGTVLDLLDELPAAQSVERVDLPDWPPATGR